MIKPIGGLGPDRIGPMAGVPPEPVVRFDNHPDQLDLPGRRKRLRRAYLYEWEQDGARYRLTCRAGFEHDGASVPRIVWSLYPPHPLDRAAVGHDYGYKGAARVGDLWVNHGGGWEAVAELPGRKWWDVAFKIWLDMDRRGPGRFRRWAAFRGVRWGGKRPWKRGNS